LFERAEDIPYIQEVVAITIVGVLLLVMAISIKRRSTKRARERDIQINTLRQHRYNSRSGIGNTFGLDDNPLR
jgi:type II secretory pathway pseudopilin PulG